MPVMMQPLASSTAMGELNSCHDQVVTAMLLCYKTSVVIKLSVALPLALREKGLVLIEIESRRD